MDTASGAQKVRGDSVEGGLSPQKLSGARVDLGAIEVRMARHKARARLFGTPLTATRLGRFELRERIGAGGMGVVYEAHDPQLDRRVAIKVLRTDTGLVGSARGSVLSRSSLRELHAEAQAMARLSHPNVVTVFDVGEVDGRVYIAMEYVPPPTLRGWLEAGAHPVEAVVAVFTQAGAGLAAAHLAGLVHRDFKPENVVVPPDGPVRVMDFGLARELVEGATQEGSPASASGSFTATRIAGTPNYMAPEQLRGRALDARSDQWSFCVTLYEALYGRRPFSPAELREGPPSLVLPREGREGGAIPERVSRVLRRGLAFAPRDRYVSMGALLDELRSPPREGLRRSMLTSVALVVLTVVVGLAAGAVILRRSSSVVSGPTCTPQRERVAAVWDGSQAEALRAHFGRVGSSHADATAERVIAIFGAYEVAWLTAQESACHLASREWGTREWAAQMWASERSRSGGRVQAREACLEDRLSSWADTRELLLGVGGDGAGDRAGELGPAPATVDRAVSLALGLPSVADCEWPERTRGPQRAIAPELRRRLDRHAGRVRARVDARQLDAADEALAAARVELRSTASRSMAPTGGMSTLMHPEVEAVLAGLEAELAVVRAEPERALEQLDYMIEQASAGGLVHLVAEAAVMQAEVEANLRADAKAARVLVRVAKVALATAAASPELRGELELVQARVEYDGGHFEAGRAASEAAIEHFERAGDRGRLELAGGLTMLAMQIFAVGDYDHARVLAERAESLQRELLGEHHPALANTEMVMGALELVEGRGAEAAVRFRRAASLRRESLGPDHPRYGQVLLNLGNAYLEMGDPAGALVEYSRALAIFDAALGEDDPRRIACLMNLGASKLELGDIEGAEQAFREVIERSRAKGDAGAVALANATGNLARCLGQRGRFQDAQTTYEESLALREVLFGEDHPKTAVLCDDLGRFFVGRGEIERGALLIERGHRIRLARLGPNHPMVARSEISMGLVALARGQHTLAVQSFERALEINEGGSRSELRGDARWNLARAKIGRGDPGDFEAAREGLLRSRGELRGSIYEPEMLRWCAGQSRRGGASPCR